MWCNMLRPYWWNSRVIIFGRNLSKSTKLYVTPRQNMSNNKAELAHTRKCMKEIFFAAVKAVSPKNIVDKKVDVVGKKLYVGRKRFDLKENVYLVGFGKAVMGMAIALEAKLGKSLKKGIVSVPKVCTDALWLGDNNIEFPKLDNPVIEFREGSVNNQADERSLETTHDIMDLVEPLTAKDTLIVLVSGGGSALLYMPRPVIDTDDKLQLCKALQNAGANIVELNIVRRKLSLIKGGGLARIAFPANVITLILSDIVGDPVHLIASGPTVYSPKEPEEVVDILKKYDLFKTLEGDMKKIITQKETFDDDIMLTRPLKPKKLSKKEKAKLKAKAKEKSKRSKKKKGPTVIKPIEFKHVTNHIIANNIVAMEAAEKEAETKNLTPIMLRNDVQGDVHVVSLAYVDMANLVCLAMDGTMTKEEFFERMGPHPILSVKAPKVDQIYNSIENVDRSGVILIAGGEPTVTVKGTGKGGRNQELALHFAMDWLAKINANPRLAAFDVTMFSGATDGQDGPTDVTGAFGYAAMGPIVYDLYTKLKSKMMIEVAKAEAREAKEVKKLEPKPTPAPCKTEVLSGYITVGRKKEKEESSDNAVQLSTKVTEFDDDDEFQGIHPLILQTMEVERMLPENTLQENDTYNFYSRFYKGIDLIRSGFTGTNVMDLHFIHIKRRTCDCEIEFSKDRKSEDIMDLHDLHIDPQTIERYRRLKERYSFDRSPYLDRDSLTVAAKKDTLNLTIIDDNIADPCCNKKRKMPKP